MRFTFLEDFLALVFPQTCCGCKKSLFRFEKLICKHCIANLPVTSYHLMAENNDLTVKLMGLTDVRKAISLLRFTKGGLSKKLLHHLKYKNKPELGVELGKIYGYRLKESGFNIDWDQIIPVPLHPIKLKRRGYNQSERFAAGLSLALNVPVNHELKRIRYTETQTRKSRLQRWENVSEVFTLVENHTIMNKKILLVDDVMTTGATLAACANVLLQSSVSSVDLAVIAAGR
ncbi:ComF family protein [Anditalea andensis]|uniref:Competence protein ComF n=1 Tax=Anditalea andensis TaxID=1048983 RepID=A0A074L164_9BACT|nr:phosphoribosyltransferase family protein [Anditalea andensis]KEO73583.1 competence protein ComF [Anditalea andensis]